VRDRLCGLGCGRYIACLELDRGEVVQTRVGADLVVVLAPRLDDRGGLLAVAKPFHAQARVAQLAVEALVGAVLPRLARVAQDAVDARGGEPPQNCTRDELRAVVAFERVRGAMEADEVRKHLDHAGRSNAAGDVDRQRFARVFVDHCQTFQLLPVGAGVEDEVVGPDPVGARRRRRKRSRRRAAARPLARHLQLGAAPQAMGALDPHRVSIAAEEDPDAAVAVARILPSQLAHLLHGCRILPGLARLVAHSRAGGPKQRARSAL